MSKRENVTADILKQTIAILKTEGSSGVTMRQVAGKTGITLSNLQYYYADRTKLFQATAAFFFNECEKTILNELSAIDTRDGESAKEFIRKLLDMLIVDGGNDDNHGIFREIWALMLRDAELAETVHRFYKNYSNWLVQLISGFTSQPEKIISLLIPYAEGYAVIGADLTLKRQEIIEMLLEIIWQMKVKT
ncbi:TetR/AcrR family transcriptional regulator [Olivibacter sp. CPCC 100613]|uniref:TetR/AcrR family transcriptional regulator n=1 Tax=Olivibacter sp. CPCC 100613 TaxID=3079931 RepID=UPI002FF74144